MAAPLPKPKKNREVVIPIALAVSLGITAVAGGVAWGQAGQRITSLERQAEKQETANANVQRIWRKQGVLETQINTLGVQQRLFRKDTKAQLEQVLQHLRNQR